MVLEQLMWYFGEERQFVEMFFHVDQLSREAEREFGTGQYLGTKVCGRRLGPPREARSEVYC